MAPASPHILPIISVFGQKKPRKSKTCELHPKSWIFDPIFGVFFMTKYSEELRRQVVQEHLAEGLGSIRLAKRHGIDRSAIRRWIAAYRVHGDNGLRRKTSRYDAQFKLSVLLHMWQAELSYRQVAAIFDIRSPGCIGQWERLYHDGGLAALAPRPRERPRKMNDSPPPQSANKKPTVEERSREELLKEIEYLRAEVAYLKKLDALLQSKKAAAPKKKRK